MNLTREQIESVCATIIDCDYPITVTRDEIAAVCDLALAELARRERERPTVTNEPKPEPLTMADLEELERHVHALAVKYRAVISGEVPQVGMLLGLYVRLIAQAREAIELRGEREACVAWLRKLLCGQNRMATGEDEDVANACFHAAYLLELAASNIEAGEHRKRTDE